MYEYQQNNPYAAYFRPQAPVYGPRIDVVHVNGKNGADAFIMPPNSSALLLDENQPIVYLAQTDGAGYKTVTPYEIRPYEQKAVPDITTLEQRIARLEGMLYESDTAKHEQRTDTRTAKPRKGAGDDCTE